MNSRRAIVLVNLGTPEMPEENAIRVYLKQFLSDPRVVDLPRWLWLPILNLIILRARPPKLVEKYNLIWGRKDGPIRNITNALAQRVCETLENTPVYTAMTYGQPSIEHTLSEIDDVDEIIVVPLFAQYAGATTGAVEDAFEGRHPASSNMRIIRDYHDDPGYIDALAESIRKNKGFRDMRPHLVFSYHGIPVSQANKDPRYEAQCRRTSKLVAEKLGLSEDGWRVTFQSRFGPAPWLQPYTDETMAGLPGEGKKHVLVVCPGFAVDCLETIEEIKILNRETFLAAGGESFVYVKALNASWAHARLIADVILKS